MRLNRSGEDYLKTIYDLLQRHGTSRSSDIADYLNVSRASVCNAIRYLKEGGYVIMDDHKKIRLTQTGLKTARYLYEKHCVLREGLIFLGIDPETAGKDACRIEHDISTETFGKLKEFWEKERKNL